MPDSGSVVTRKAQLRAHLLSERRRLPEQVRRAAALRVREVAAAVVAAAAAGGTVAGYEPFGAEPGGPELPEALARAVHPGGRLLLPVLRDDRDLDWVAYQDPDQDQDPSGVRLDPTAVGQAALLVVPAVAVDRRGVRLGRGGGSYDRALARVAAGVPVVALLYDGELRDDPVPADPHDRRVTAVVTPARGLVELPTAG